ncbi:MAG: hypothetical protein ABFD50_11620 [Smithella sp.]
MKVLEVLVDESRRMSYKGSFATVMYNIPIELPIAREFEKNIAPSKAIDVIQDLILAVANGTIIVSRKK